MLTTMHTRILELINYVSKGNKAEFARTMGWKPQYLNTLLNGNRIGISPLITMLRILPELNARWLLLGEGKMFIGEGDEYITINSKVNYNPTISYCVDNPKGSIYNDILSPNGLSVSDISEDDLKTSVEKERELRHAQICDRYAELVKQYPNVKPYRLISNVAMQFNRSVPNIRAILIANKLYPNKK